MDTNYNYKNFYIYEIPYCIPILYKIVSDCNSMYEKRY